MDLVISHVYKDFGRGPVLQDVSLTVRQGETVCLMGPSGLGKTTLLRCVAGLETPDAGAVTGVPRRLGYVFQEDRLCDNFSAVANVRLATGRTLPEPEILRHLEELGLAGSARRPVSQLSGGRRPPGGRRPGRVRRAAASAAGRGLQGPGRPVPPGHRGLYPPPHAGGVPAVRHPRPGGGRPAGGPLSGPVHPMIAIWNRKNVSHSETFR